MLCGITYVCNINHDTNEPTYETTGSQTQRTDWRLPSGSGLREGWTGRLKLADESFHM